MNSTPASDEIVAKYKLKFEYLSDFFEFVTVNNNNTKDLAAYQIVLKCKKCAPQKVLNSNSWAITSNLKVHVKLNQACILSQFEKLKEEFSFKKCRFQAYQN